MKLDRLEPCPFCGEPGKVEQGPDCGRWYAACSSDECLVCMGEGFVGEVTSHLFATEAEAIASWNKRHVPEGFAIVPVEPSERMIDVGNEQANDCTDDFTACSSCIAAHVWTAMLDAVKGDV